MGLKEIAKEVNDIIIEDETTDYKRISEKLVKKHNFNQKDEKNIKRRVYDALNVIKAIRGINNELGESTTLLLKEKHRTEKKIVSI
jgi:hypothetical protein